MSGTDRPTVEVPIEHVDQLARTASHLRSIAEQLAYVASVLESTVERITEANR